MDETTRIAVAMEVAWTSLGLFLGFAAGVWECLAAVVLLNIVLGTGALVYWLLGKVAV